jgi:hypothetical protein
MILKTGGYFYMVVVVKGKEDTNLLDKIDSIIMDIQNKYGNVIDTWAGEMNDVEGINEIIIELLPLEELSEEERENIKDRGLLKKAIEVWDYLMEED